MKQGVYNTRVQRVPIKLISLLSAFFFSSFAYANCNHTADAFSCVKYVKNYDGDTLTVKIPSVHPLLGENISVRILGIDAPELRSDSPCERQMAQKAKEELKEILAEGGRIDLESIGRDKYFRVLAKVTVDGRDVADMMLRRGLAVPYDGGTRPETNWCSSL
jgi:micrococcal nuclease